jgi:hypothetical protein
VHAHVTALAPRSVRVRVPVPAVSGPVRLSTVEIGTDALGPLMAEGAAQLPSLRLTDGCGCPIQWWGPSSRRRLPRRLTGHYSSEGH